MMKITTEFIKGYENRNAIYELKISKKLNIGKGCINKIVIEGWGKDELEAQSNTYPLIRELYDTLEAFIMENNVM